MKRWKEYPYTANALLTDYPQIELTFQSAVEVPNPVMLTYVKLAVGYGGAFNQASAFANTWAQFSTGSGPANVTTWDGRSMQYYTAGFNSCAVTAQSIVENAERLRSCWKAHWL